MPCAVTSQQSGTALVLQASQLRPPASASLAKPPNVSHRLYLAGAFLQQDMHFPIPPHVASSDVKSMT
jgi:hypothetical protein